jgi:hypothetical protein
MPASRPRVVAILPRLCPSTWINIVKPLVALHDAGRLRARVTLEALASPRDVKSADLVVFCRNVRPDRAELLHTATASGVPVVYDLDDNFFELTPDSAVGRAFAQPEQLAMLTEYLSAASLVRVYSRPLLARAGLLNSRVEMVASAVDLRQVRRPEKSSSGPLKLIYATSRMDDPLGQIFLPALRRLLDENGSRVEGHFWGPRPPADLRTVRHHAMVHNYDRFLRCFSSAGFEIGLAPLAADLFHRSKTNTKFREYGACGVAGVYSDVDVYSGCVRDGETGLLVPNNAEAWYRALQRLVDDTELRRHIQRQARAEIEKFYSQEKFEAVFLRQIEQLVDSSRSQPGVWVPVPHTGPRQPRLRRLMGLFPQAIRHLRRTGLTRCWNSLRWIASSGWSMARLQWRLREGRGGRPSEIH